MVGSEVRANRLMWFLAGAVCMALYLLGPHAILRNAYDVGERFSLWFNSL